MSCDILVTSKAGCVRAPTARSVAQAGGGPEQAQRHRGRAKIMVRLGRAKQRFARAARQYQVAVAKDDTGTQVSAINLRREPSNRYRGFSIILLRSRQVKRLELSGLMERLTGSVAQVDDV